MLFQERAAPSGDRQALFSRIYTDCFPVVYRFVFARVKRREIAEDITQDVFVKALPTLSLESGYESPLPYLYRIARNALIDHYRKKKDLPLDDELAACIPGQCSGDDLALARERSRMIEEALATLGEEPRFVLTLLFMEELDTAEVAAIAEKTEESVRQIKSRALRALRAHFEKTYGKDDPQPIR